MLAVQENRLRNVLSLDGDWNICGLIPDDVVDLEDQRNGCGCSIRFKPEDIFRNYMCLDGDWNFVALSVDEFIGVDDQANLASCYIGAGFAAAYLSKLTHNNFRRRNGMIGRHL